jgi:Mg/Co/Ni transporter MgtE
MNENIIKRIDDALFNFYLEADESIINDSVKENILDREGYEKKKKRFLFLAQAMANKQKNDYLISLAEQVQQAIEKGIEKPISILRKLIQGETTPALCSNLDKLSKEDIIELIKEKNLLELIESLEENDQE